MLLPVYVLYVYQAKEAIKEAQRCDPGSIFTQFSVYKIAVLDNNVEKGIWKNLLCDEYKVKADYSYIFSKSCVYEAVHLP